MVGVHGAEMSDEGLNIPTTGWANLSALVPDRFHRD
jgi:hypothetical protein